MKTDSRVSVLYKWAPIPKKVSQHENKIPDVECTPPEKRKVIYGETICHRGISSLIRTKEEQDRPYGT